MAHMKKRMTFHGVDYIVVPVELWDAAKDVIHRHKSALYGPQIAESTELHDNMEVYEGSNEPTELSDE